MDDEIKSGVKRIIDYLYPDIENKQKKVLIYGFMVMLAAIIDYLLIFVLGFLCGVVKLTLVAAVTASLIKVFSGGVHASSFIKCALTGALIFTSLGLAAKNFAFLIQNYTINAIILIFILGILSLYFYSPVGVKEKPISNQKKYFKLKLFSYLMLIILIGVYIILTVNGISPKIIAAGLLGLMWQFFSLTPIAYKLFGRIYVKEKYTK